MLAIKNGTEWVALRTDDYTITRKYDGQDELKFKIDTSDPCFLMIAEETQVFETTEKQYYICRRLQSSNGNADVTCDLDLDDWKSEILVGYSNFLTSAYGTLNDSELKPTGWTVVDESSGAHDSDHRVVEMDAPRPLDVALAVEDKYMCAIRFDTWNKVATIVWPDEAKDSGVRYTLSSNLKNAPAYSGKTSDICTRLYVEGKDGLTFESINNGKNYVENFTYTDRIISDVWIADDYDDASILLSVSKKKIEVMGMPTREWTLNMIDLYSMKPKKYGELQTTIHQAITVYDEFRKQTFEARVKGMEIKPHYPEENKMTVTNGWASDSTLRKKLDELLNKRTQNKTGSTGSYGQYITYNYKNGIADIYFNMDQTNIPMVAGQTMTVDLTSYFPAAYKSAQVINGYGYMTTADGTMVAEAHPMISGGKIYANILFLKTGTFSGHIFAYAKVRVKL